MAAAMVDSGATGLFMDKRFADREGLRRLRLKKPLPVYNIDGTLNQSGSITEFVQIAITVDGHKHWADFLVTDLGQEDLILGLPWLRRTNPEVDWSKGLLSMKARRATVEELPDEEERVVGGVISGDGIIEEIREEDSKVQELEVKEELEAPDSPETEKEEKAPRICVLNANRAQRRKWIRQKVIRDVGEQVWIAAGYTYSQQLAEAAQKRKPQKSFEEMVPEQYRQY